ncbi:MAG: AAA family ATPase [Clostridium sp.]|nr:AAA family ATPase [Clostridium sp.]
MKKETIIISTYNNKGGVAKTTYNCMLALYLAREQKKVLVIDGDPQSNLTSRLYDYDHEDLTFGDLILNANTTSMADGIIRGFIPEYPTLDIIPASRDMRYMEEVLLKIDDTSERDLVIAKWLGDNIDTVNSYDYIIWDISPSTSVLGRNILNTCNRLLFVSEYNNIDSIEAIAKFINEFSLYRFNNGFKMPEYAILVNKYKKTMDAEKLYEPFEKCIDIIQENLLSTKMIESSVIRNCNLYKKDIIAYTEENKVNKKAMNLFIDIVNELKEKEII